MSNRHVYNYDDNTEVIIEFSDSTRSEIRFKLKDAGYKPDYARVIVSALVSNMGESKRWHKLASIPVSFVKLRPVPIVPIIASAINEAKNDNRLPSGLPLAGIMGVKSIAKFVG